MKLVQFTATIKRFGKQGEKTGWTYIEIPADIAEKLKKDNRQSFRVKGKLDTHKISGLALLPMGGGGFIMTLNAAVRKMIAKKVGAMLEVSLQEDKADFVFIPGLQSSAFIETLKTGTLSYPEDSATIVANVAIISTSPINNSLQIILKGPGVKDTETIYVAGLNPAILTDIKEQNQEFPLGIDLILTDTKNRIICIPRSNDITFSPVGNNN